jgi:hypothetical protein
LTFRLPAEAAYFSIDADGAPDQLTTSDNSIARSYGESIAVAEITSQSRDWFGSQTLS